jgi:predicted ferric reductase
MIKIHIHLGYSTVGLVVFATLLFLVHDGTLCAGGEEYYCNRLMSEIMITGYGITVLSLFVAATSYFRHIIPYEIFYAVHHLVFLLYIVTVLHTYDKVMRSNQKNRYQTFMWFSTTILFYVCDGAMMHMNQTHRARLMSSSVISGSNCSKTVIIKLRRPVLFDFKPGQYAFLRLSKIDRHWHPFSIASGPSSNYLEFYIEVFGEKSWTRKLWRMLDRVDGSESINLEIDFDVMGPCGTSLGKTEDFSHALAIGAGTGIVPILSLFKQVSCWARLMFVACHICSHN